MAGRSSWKERADADGDEHLPGRARRDELVFDGV